MRVLRFTVATTPITEPVTKFGGQPVWIAEPEWPLSRSTGEQMRFICQIALPEHLCHGTQRMAYLFMTDPADGFVDGTFEPDGGENAVILQPAPFDRVVSARPRAIGPSLRAAHEEQLGFIASLSGARRQRILRDVELGVTEVEVDPAAPDPNLKSRLFGEPLWLQNDETPAGGPWDLIVQIDSANREFDVNFGDAGVGYAFIRRDGKAARFRWQCC